MIKGAEVSLIKIRQRLLFKKKKKKAHRENVDFLLEDIVGVHNSCVA